MIILTGAMIASGVSLMMTGPPTFASGDAGPSGVAAAIVYYLSYGFPPLT